MSRVAIGILGLAVLAPGLGRAQSPVVAVFDVEDQTRKLQPAVVRQLTSYLSARLAAGASLRVIPSSQIKQRLSEQKRDSYKTCYDERCQIEIGRELAADKSVSTQIMQLGSRCAVVSTLYDLRSATTARAASEKSGCAQDEIVEALEQVAEALKASPAVRAGVVAVRSEPLGAAVLVDDQRRGETPAELELPAGTHRLRLEMRERTAVTREVRVLPGKVQVLSIKLALTAAASRRLAATERRRRAQRLAVTARQRADEVRRSSQASRRRGKTIRGYSALGVGAACLAAAGALYGVGLGQRASALDDYHAADAPERVAEMNSAWSDVEAAQEKITAGHVLLGLGLAAIGYSVYELVTRPEAPRPSAPGLSVGLAAGRGGGSLLISGRY